MTSPGGGQRVPNQPFQESGEWRSYDDAGRLLRWQDQTQTWVPIALAPMSGYAPVQATPAGAFASLRKPAAWVYALLAVSMATTVLYAAGAAMQYRAVGDLIDGSSGDLFDAVERVDDADDVISAGLILQALATIGTAGVFIWWTRRATCNVYALNAADPQFTPGWAVGWWFVPFANLVQPLRVVNQAWRASDPGAVRSGDPRAWKAASVGGTLLTWWLAWLIASSVGSIGYNIYDGTDDFETARDASAVILAGQIGLLVAAVLAMLVVRRLTQRQEVAAQLAGIR